MTVVSKVEYFGVLKVTERVESVSEGIPPVKGTPHSCKVDVSVGPAFVVLVVVVEVVVVVVRVVVVVVVVVVVFSDYNTTLVNSRLD